MAEFRDDLLQRAREAELEYEQAQARVDELRRKRDRLKGEVMKRFQEAQEKRKIQGKLDAAGPQLKPSGRVPERPGGNRDEAVGGSGVVPSSGAGTGPG